MKIKWGMMMTDGRGKLGGQVASKNRSGAYVRTKVTPTNPRTSAQMAVRYAFSAISKAWSSLLSPEDRQSWNESANSGVWNRTDIFGDAHRPSGKNLFTSINRGYQEAGLPMTAVVPLKADFPEIEISRTAWDGNLVVFNGSLPALVGDSAYTVYATPALSPGVSYFANQLRKIMVIPASAPDPEVYFDDNFASAYKNVFGDPVVGGNVHFGVKAIINGQISPLVTSSIVIGA